MQKHIEMITRKLVYLFGIVSIYLGFAILTYIFYLLFYPFQTVTIRQPIPVITKTVKQGDDIIYAPYYCRYFQGSGRVYRTIVGKEFIPTATVDTVTQLGCSTVKIHLATPRNIEPGTYHIQIVAEFQVNPLRIIHVSYYSENFEIIK